MNAKREPSRCGIGVALVLSLGMPVPGVARQAAPPIRIAIHGRVLEEGRQRGLPGAVVRLRPGQVVVESDDAGRFQFRDVVPGVYELGVELLGYGSRLDTLRIEGNRDVDVRVSLSPKPIALAPISVEIRAAELSRLGFYDRRDEATGAHFMTAADIERRQAVLTSDVLVTIPRVDVVSAGVGRKIVTFTRGYHCRPDLFVDGIRMEGEVDVDRVNPSEIAGIEVYPGLTAPVQYRRNSCGALLIWTKRGG